MVAYVAGHHDVSAHLRVNRARHSPFHREGRTLALTTPLVFGLPPALQTAIGSTQGGNGGLSSGLSCVSNRLRL
jgi:hypothetical protein